MEVKTVFVKFAKNKPLGYDISKLPNPYALEIFSALCENQIVILFLLDPVDEIARTTKVNIIHSRECIVIEPTAEHLESWANIYYSARRRNEQATV